MQAPRLKQYPSIIGEQAEVNEDTKRHILVLSNEGATPLQIESALEVHFGLVIDVLHKAGRYVYSAPAERITENAPYLGPGRCLVDY